MLPVKNEVTFAHVLSGLLAILLLVSSIIGLLYGGCDLYEFGLMWMVLTIAFEFGFGH